MSSSALIAALGALIFANSDFIGDRSGFNFCWRALYCAEKFCGCLISDDVFA